MPYRNCKNAYGRICGTTCKKQLAIHGESVWYLPLKSPATHEEKAEAKKAAAKKKDEDARVVRGQEAELQRHAASSATEL